MNNLDHVKNYYPENYKMDLSETMKAALTKAPVSGNGNPVVAAASNTQVGGNHASLSADVQHSNVPGVGYVTEKLYMLLQLYLQNKGWNPSVELLQCFSELKDSAMLPSAAYLQILASRLTLDGQGRLILRENGKIVLPFEHFANAVMLKHMSGPHGLHLSIEATVRAVVESYTIGRDNFGMEKEFVVEVVQSCPSPACRYYKNHLTMPPMPYIEQPYASVSTEFLQHMPPPHSVGGEVDLSKGHNNQKVPQPISHLAKQNIQSQMNNHQHHQQIQQQQHQITAAIIQQQNRVMAQQNLDKFSTLSAIDKQRVLQQLDKKSFEQSNPIATSSTPIQVQGNNIQHSSPSPHLSQPTLAVLPHTEPNQKSYDVLRSNLESLESNKDLLALHNGAWGGQDVREVQLAGQEKIVRAFSELMKNMSRMKTYIRPSMCKPYGKQSESLQKTLLDTIQLVQSLRNCLPAPHIPVSSWKSEDRHRKDPEAIRVESN